MTASRDASGPSRRSRILSAAVSDQRALAARVRETPLPRAPRIVAGADVSYDAGRRRLFAAAVAFDGATGEVVETAHFTGRTPVPYVPGLLSAREGPAVIAAVERLSSRPDLLLCDGQGRAHPRRCGLACFVGVSLDVPTIGVAKSRLVGTHREPGRRRGSTTRLVDGGETVGLVVRTRDGVRPLFVSVGHRVDLTDARRAVLAWCRGVRLPEPVRAADREVSAMRRASRPRRGRPADPG